MGPPPSSIDSLTFELSKSVPIPRQCDVLTLRASALLERRGGLGAAFTDVDRALGLSDSFGMRNDALRMRALIFAFLGADSLAHEDLLRCDAAGEKMSKRMDMPAAFVCCAADWHRARRVAMLRMKPDLGELYIHPIRDTKETSAVIVLVACVHLGVAVRVVPEMDWEEVVLLAATVGAVCAYGCQALTHELGHMTTGSAATTGGSQRALFNSIGFASAAFASSLTNFPWHFYYWNYHNRHHAHTGGERDRDGDILFHAWHAPPTIAGYNLSENKFTRWLWTFMFSVSIYFMFCRAKLLLDSPHTPSITYEGCHVVMHLFVLFCAGWRSWIYLIASASFSLGAFGHPFIQFWLTQHAFRKTRISAYENVNQHAKAYLLPLIQPTCSATKSSRFWQVCNFGELRHVEHHDFPTIPYTRACQLSQMLPAFYISLEPAFTPLEALLNWVNATAPKRDIAWMKSLGDFAGRAYHLQKLRVVMEREAAAGMCSSSDDDDGAAWNEDNDVDDENAFVAAMR